MVWAKYPLFVYVDPSGMLCGILVFTRSFVAALGSQI